MKTRNSKSFESQTPSVRARLLKDFYRVFVVQEDAQNVYLFCSGKAGVFLSALTQPSTHSLFIGGFCFIKSHIVPPLRDLGNMDMKRILTYWS